jgi:hypothetical protein
MGLEALLLSPVEAGARRIPFKVLAAARTSVATLRTFLGIALTIGLLGACTTIPVGERAGLRQEINNKSDDTIMALVAQEPEQQRLVDSAVGYFSGSVSAVKGPVVGIGSGVGVLYDKKAGTRTYMNIKRFDFGVGLGAGNYRVLVLLQNRDVLEEFRSGVWKSAVGAESASGSEIAAAATDVEEDVSVHLISESGAVLTVSARVIRLSVNDDLTDTGVSEVSIPGTGFTVVDEQGADAPRVWDHKLPFFAQKVIDRGFDLPLPYGIGLTYVNIDQEMLLGALEVGINGREKEPFTFVSFDNASAQNQAVQLKLDAWLFPFMNVFGLLGKIDGEAPLDVVIDGNGMLAHLGISCTGPLPNPLCATLENQTATLDITAKFRGTSYGIGTVLAGAKNNWFVTVPLSFVYADMEGKGTDGISITVTPRVGRLINLGPNGNLALYTGGNYLQTELTVTGTVVTPNGGLVLDYTIEQKNRDSWNVVLGGNWDINKRWSWSAEYNGFVGSREAFITSVVRRF